MFSRLNRSLSSGIAALLVGLVPVSASAMTCDEIMNMVTLNIPSSIVVQTMQGSGQKFTAQDIQCLQSKGAPADIVAAARAQSATAIAAPVPDAPTPVPAIPSEGFDSEETLGGSTFSGGADTSDEANPDDEEPGSGGPADLAKAIEDQRAKKHQGASIALYEMLRDNRYPDQETRIQYHLAKSLDELGLYHSAQHYFMEVVRKGPANPYFKYALPRLIRIAERTGNDYELLRIVARIPPESFPRQARSHLYYLMGRKLFEKEDLTEASNFFSQVSAKSDLSLRAKYYEGIIHQQRGKLKSAVLSFREVWSAETAVVGDARQAQEIDDIKDLSLMNIARIYYGLQRFDNADTYYSMVPRESAYWAESLFERSWTSFMRSDLNQALGLLLTVESPYFSESEFIPEVTYLRALTFFNLCEYNEVERTLIAFDARYKPMQTEIEGFLNQYKDQKDLWDQAYDQYFTSDHADSKLASSLFSRVLQNRDLSAMVRHLDLMDQEVTYINEQKSQWRDTVGSELLKIIEEDRVLYKKKAGNELLREMLKINQMLEDLLTRSEIVRFEVVDAQRADYEFKASNTQIDAGVERKIDFSTSRDTIYWPFNGEFWRDELGYYRYTEHGSCK